MSVQWKPSVQSSASPLIPAKPISFQCPNWMSTRFSFPTLSHCSLTLAWPEGTPATSFFKTSCVLWFTSWLWSTQAPYCRELQHLQDLGRPFPLAGRAGQHVSRGHSERGPLQDLLRCRWQENHGCQHVKCTEQPPDPDRPWRLSPASSLQPRVWADPCACLASGQRLWWDETEIQADKTPAPLQNDQKQNSGGQTAQRLLVKNFCTIMCRHQGLRKVLQPMSESRCTDYPTGCTTKASKARICGRK